MTSVLERPYFADIEAFILALSSGHLLSACGGPYPARDDIDVVPSKQIAINLIFDAMIDAMPQHELDKAVTNGLREANVMLGQTWLRALVNGGITTQQKAFEKKIKKLVSNISSSRFQGRAEITYVQEHFIGLFTTTSLLIYTKRLLSCSSLALAADLAIQGYLPVDLALETKGDCQTSRVLIY